MPLVGPNLADKIRSDMLFPLPVSMQLLAWGNSIVSHVQSTSIVSFAPGLVTGVALPNPGPLLNGAASNGLIVGPTGAVLAPIIQSAIGYPYLSPQLLALCTAICLHIVAFGRVSFASGNVTGVCTNTPLTSGTFTGTGTNGIITGLDGLVLANLAHTMMAFPGSLSVPLTQFCTAITTYIMANATVSGGSMTGTLNIGGGALIGGTGAGGLIA